MSKKIILLVISIMVIFGGLFGSKFLQVTSAMSNRQAPTPPIVSTTKVTQEEWAASLSSVGNINPVLGVILSNEIAGMVTKLHFESGQTVKKNDLLLELNTSTDRAELNGFIASEKLAKIKLKRQATLLKSKATSQSSYDEARANLDLARASVVAKQSTLDKKILRAPFDGVIGIRQVSLGEYIDKGHQIAPLVSLANTIADFTLPERNYADINVGQPVQITVQAYPNELFEGVIQAVNPGLHEQTRTVSVRALVENPEHKLRAGMFADVKIIISKPKPVITLPETAVLFNTYGESVYIVINKDGKYTVEQRRIETGKRNKGRVEIVSGLTVGDSVVDEGHVKLRNGLAITIANDNNP